MDGIERESGSSANVIRIRIQTDAGREVVRRYGVAFTPTFIVFDERGVERSRTSRPDEAGDRLRALLSAIR